MNALVYSSSLAAAFLGGVLALFAPCCVVSLLPTFVGAALQRGRRRLPVTTLIFAAGIAVVMLPVVFGLGLLGQVLGSHHREVFFAVGTLLVLLSLLILSGRSWVLPMPSLRWKVSGSSAGSIFTLGLASGVVSSCCAPVLAGVAAMSALAGSALGGLGLGLAYVFGMVFPLLLAVLLWDRLQLQARFSRFRVPRVRLAGRQMPWTDATAGVMFAVVGGFALYLAFTGRSTVTPDWLQAWNVRATGLAGDAAAALRSVPVGIQAVTLLLLAAGLAWALLAGRSSAHVSSSPIGPDHPGTPVEVDSHGSDPEARRFEAR